ncbi:hypothetical protein DPMN_063051 [Dreissena polymorpha]|uniref:Uncharacterized protein n=1 Tax=Dreissena polymorpha TaxID=45954 RepID=A0A9D4CAJ5_DREPO|nr:hypothetical protein DPMN_063051 [Dreissena polymorpha]
MAKVDLSEALSKVMEDIGVSEDVVSFRREICLITEHSKHSKCLNFRMNMHYFGSQIEGTTTPGMRSDIDVLLYYSKCNVCLHMGSFLDATKTKLNCLFLKSDFQHPQFCSLASIPNELNGQVSLETFLSEPPGYTFCPAP